MNVITNFRKDINMKMQDKMLQFFVVLEIILYISFLLLDILNRLSAISNLLKYTSICMCVLFVFISFLRTKNKSIILILVILIFTVIADTFLLFSDRFEIGVIAFIIVQILYSFKIKVMHQDSFKQYMLEVLCVAIIWNIVIIFLKNENFLTPVVVIASIYFIIFSANMLRAWIGVIMNRKRSEYESIISLLPAGESKHWLKEGYYEITFVIGLSLFYLCDIHVGLCNLSLLEIRIPRVIELLMSNASVFVWLYYLPSQVILSINGVMDRSEYFLGIIKN